MPPASAEKLAYNKQFYQKNKNKKQLIDAIRSILEGRKTQAKTLDKYRLTLAQVNRIRALNPNFRLVLEDTHGVKLEKLYRGKTTLAPLNTATVQVRMALTSRSLPAFPKLDANTLSILASAGPLPCTRRVFPPMLGRKSVTHSQRLGSYISKWTRGN
jgi:hypothetical protein